MQVMTWITDVVTWCYVANLGHCNWKLKRCSETWFCWPSLCILLHSFILGCVVADFIQLLSWWSWVSLMWNWALWKGTSCILWPNTWPVAPNRGKVFASSSDKMTHIICFFPITKRPRWSHYHLRLWSLKIQVEDRFYSILGWLPAGEEKWATEGHNWRVNQDQGSRRELRVNNEWDSIVGPGKEIWKVH